MTSQSNLSTIESIYDKRAPGYDHEVSDFHRRQVVDYIKWMSPKPGQAILDLACGTGGVALLAKSAVGPSGIVVGVDISQVSLDIAAAKAEASGVKIPFIRSNISSVSSISDPAIQEDAFDIISCSSALVLLPDPLAALTDWTKFLKPGGKIIFDTPTKDNMVAGHTLETIGAEMGISVLGMQRGVVDDIDKVKKILKDAGLDPSESFVSHSYKDSEVLAADGEKIFDDTIDRKGPFESVYDVFKTPEVRGIAKQRFCEILKQRADAEGKIKQQLIFSIGIGKKVEG